MEETCQGILVPDLVYPDDVPVHDAVVIRFEVILFRSFVLLEHDNGKTAFMDVLPEVGGDRVLVCSPGGSIFGGDNGMEQEVF